MAAIEEDGEVQGTEIGAGRTAVRRAISGPLTPVTSGLSRSLADTPPCRSGHVTGPDSTDSQADSARTRQEACENVRTSRTTFKGRPARRVGPDGKGQARGQA